MTAPGSSQRSSLCDLFPHEQFITGVTSAICSVVTAPQSHRRCKALIRRVIVQRQEKLLYPNTSAADRLVSETRRRHVVESGELDLSEASQNVPTQRPKRFSCFFKWLFWKQTPCVCSTAKPSQMLVCWSGGHLTDFSALPELCFCPDVNPQAARSSVKVWFHFDAPERAHERAVTFGRRPHASLTAEEAAQTRVLPPPPMPVGYIYRLSSLEKFATRFVVVRVKIRRSVQILRGNNRYFLRLHERWADRSGETRRGSSPGCSEL